LYVDHWGTYLYRSNTVVTPGQWNFVAITFDGAKTVNFYVNGSPAGSTISNGLYNYDANTFTIGGNTIGGSTTVKSFDGTMLDLAIYNSELTASDILTIYNGTPTNPSSTWVGTSSTNWSDSGNWTGAVPGATTGTTNTDTATFNQSAPNSPLIIDAGRNVQNIVFDTASVNSLVVGTVSGNALLLTGGGRIQITSTVINPQTVNAPLVLEGNYTFSSGAGNSSATLSFGGGIASGATSGVTTLTLSGSNTGANTISGALSDNGAGQLAVIKSWGGSWTLSGANTYSGNTTLTAGTLQLAGGSTNNIPNSPLITIAGGATLDVTGLANGTIALGSGNVPQTLAGAGTVNGNVTVNGGLAHGGGNAPAGSAIAGATGSTLTINGGLALHDGSVSNFTLGAPNGSGNPLVAFVNVTGTAGLAVDGTHTVNLSGTAQLGTYELFAFTSGVPLATQFSIGTNAAGNFIYGFRVISNAEVDLIVASSVAWDFNGGGNYSDNSKWTPGLVPNSAGAPAIFGNGVSNTVNATLSATIVIDGAEVAGSLAFSNTNGTGYILGNDGVSGHGIILNNNGTGAAINVSANAPQAIAANLTLADNVAFNINSGSSLSVTGNLNESGGSRSLTFTGPGTLTLGGANSFSGGTTINTGTLNAAATGALGTGPVTINSGTLNATTAGALSSSCKVTINAVGVNSALNLLGSQTVDSLTTSSTGTAAAVVAVPSGSTLLFTEALTTTGKFNAPGFGRTEIDGAPTLNSNSAITVTNGTLRFNVASGSATIGTAVSATAGLRGTLELAGAVSAFSSATSRVNIGTLASGHGLLVSGTHQQVGNIDGAGNTQVNAGSDLTANHIIQGALVIGGTMGNAGRVTIAASDPAGNPLVESLATPSASVLAGSLASSSLFGDGVDPLSLTDGLPASSEAGTVGSSAVPEPSTMMLFALALAGLIVNVRCVRHARPEFQSNPHRNRTRERDMTDSCPKGAKNA
jgi:autotransporter-associated beta strand protein